MYKTNMQSVRDRREAILRQQKEREANAFFDEILESKDGNVRRFLPPWSAEGLWRKQAWYHYGLKDRGAVVCPLKTFGRPCPACEEVEQLYKMKGDPEAQQLAKDMRAKERFFANVLNLNKNDNKVYILAFGPKLEGDIVTMMEGSGGGTGVAFGVGDITDIQTGRAVLITKTSNPKDKKLTDYGVTPATVPSPLANAEAVCAALHNLDELVLKDTLTYEAMVKMMGKGGSAPEQQSQGAQPQQQFTQPAQQPQAQFGQPAQSQPVQRMTSEFEPPANQFQQPQQAQPAQQSQPQFAAPAPQPQATTPGAEFAQPQQGQPQQGQPQQTQGATKPASALDRLRQLNASRSQGQAAK